MAWQNWWDKQIRRRRLHLWEGGRGVCIPLQPASNSVPECVWNLFGQNKGSLRTQVHEHKSQCNSSTISNITYNMRHIYQDSGYQCRTSAEKSDETPNMASRKFVRLVKDTNRTYGLDTSIGDGRSSQWTQWIWFWTSTLLIVSNFHFSLQAWLRHPARDIFKVAKLLKLGKLSFTLLTHQQARTASAGKLTCISKQRWILFLLSIGIKTTS